LRFRSSHRFRVGTLLTGCAALGLVVAAVWPGPAHATLPGPNGKIAFSSDRTGTKDIWVMNADGSGQTLVQSDGADDSYDPYPAWSPGGRDIAFMHEWRPFNHQGNVFVIHVDGSDLRQVTTDFDYHFGPTWSPDADRIAFFAGAWVFVATFPPGGDRVQIAPHDQGQYDGRPDWSPDGRLIAFDRFTLTNPYLGQGYSNIYAADPDGGPGHALTTGNAVYDDDPSISPDGNTVVFQSNRAGAARRDLYTVPISGGAPTPLTDTPTFDEAEPVWSPDGTKIAFAGKERVAGSHLDVYTINADGTGRQQLTTSAGEDHQPSWQRIVRPPGYPRPKGATPIKVSLVPAYAQCITPNRTHGSPLAFGSCNPPVPASGRLTVGTPDANGLRAKSVGFVLLNARAGDPSTPADEADVRITTSVTDVRFASNPSWDYAGDLATALTLRLTDRQPVADGDEPLTTPDFSFPVAVPCTPTADTTIGSQCSLTTTADTVLPGMVPEGLRSIWALDKVRVLDGGDDGDATTSDDPLPFMTQGVFVP
jgi:dipeptidyl aminopeptidase/acylaminoacyl peptidase